MITFRASLWYELRMQLHKPSLWITMAVLAGLTVAIPFNITLVFDEPDAQGAMVSAARLTMMVLPIGFGSLVADRLVRDERLNVRPVLDATPGGLSSRLAGKYLGACLAGAIPVVGFYLIVAAVYAVRRGDPAALGAMAAITATVLVPGLLFVGAFAMLCPLVMPAPLFRVLFAGYWIWTSLVNPVDLPTLNGTVATPVNDYVLAVFFQPAQGGPGGGEVPGATLNLLRPEPSTATALLSIAVLLVLAALAMAGARALLTRSTR